MISMLKCAPGVLFARASGRVKWFSFLCVFFGKMAVHEHNVYLYHHYLLGGSKQSFFFFGVHWLLKVERNRCWAAKSKRNSNHVWTVYYYHVKEYKVYKCKNQFPSLFLSPLHLSKKMKGTFEDRSTF